MAYKVIILYRLYMPSYFLGTFTEYPFLQRIYIVLSKLCCMKFLYNPIFEKRSFYVLQFFIHNVVKRILKTC